MGPTSQTTLPSLQIEANGGWLRREEEEETGLLGEWRREACTMNYEFHWFYRVSSFFILLKFNIKKLYSFFRLWSLSSIDNNPISYPFKSLWFLCKNFFHVFQRCSEMNSITGSLVIFNFQTLQSFPKFIIFEISSLQLGFITKLLWNHNLIFNNYLEIRT